MTNAWKTSKWKVHEAQVEKELPITSWLQGHTHTEAQLKCSPQSAQAYREEAANNISW